MAEKGMIVFDSAEENGERFGHWPVNVWPPPDLIWLASAIGYSGVSIPLHEDDLEGFGSEFQSEHFEWSVTPFRKVKQSDLPEEHGMSHVVRGAQYVPE